MHDALSEFYKVMQQHNLGDVANSIPHLCALAVATMKESLKSSYVWQSYARNKKGAVF